MTVTVVVGAQWGDEGKGRIVDHLAMNADLVMRFQGGDNAGHTVINQYGKHALHSIPSGIFNPNTINIIGTGCVVNPQALTEEMAGVAAAGVNLDNLWISSRTQIVMPYHRLLDGLEEARRSKKNAIGTTKRGIGPAYADKATRSGLRMGDLRHPEWLKGRVHNAVEVANLKIKTLGGELVDEAEIYALCQQYQAEFGARIVDTVPIVKRILNENGNILLEGQLGIMRGLDWGIYPYVTSSNPTAAYAVAGAGLPANTIGEVVGVTKAYSTAVGTGPLPVELFDADGEKLRDIGKEYGATTGRPRRCGWFDGVAIRHATWLNGMTKLAITKLDVLDSFDALQVCVGYQMPDGEVITDYLPDTPLLDQAKPIYEEWAGWNCSTEACRDWDTLPPQAQAYVNRLSELAGVPIGYVSVGPVREAMFEVV